MCRRERRDAWRRRVSDSPVTDQEARYDRSPRATPRCGRPVHRPATLALLDEIAPTMDRGRGALVDVGCGTGALAAAAVRRWPAARARRRRRLGGDAPGRRPDRRRAARRRRASGSGWTRRPPTGCRSRTAPFDVALTAFVLQLVPSRHRALREVRRVLRPAADAGDVTWMRGGGAARGGPTPTTTRWSPPGWSRGTVAAATTTGSPEEAAADPAARGLRAASRPRDGDRWTTGSRPRRSSRSSPASTTRTSSPRWTPAARAALEADLLARLRGAPARRGCGSRSRSCTRPAAA